MQFYAQSCCTPEPLPCFISTWFELKNTSKGTTGGAHPVIPRCVPPLCLLLNYCGMPQSRVTLVLLTMQLWSRLHVQLSADEVRADLVALGLPGSLQGPAVRAREGQAWVMLELVDDAHMPAPPLRESWFEPPAEGSHGHPLQPARQRSAVVWPPPTLTVRQGPASSSVSERPQRSARRPARFDGEVVQGPGNGRTGSAVADAFEGAAAGPAGAARAASAAAYLPPLPPSQPLRPGWVPTLLPFPGRPPRPSSGQADSSAEKAGEQNLPLLRPTTPTQFRSAPTAAAAAAPATDPTQAREAPGGVDIALSHGLLLEGGPLGWATGNVQHHLLQLHQQQQHGGGTDASASSPQAAAPSQVAPVRSVLTWQQMQTILLQLIANSVK